MGVVVNKSINNLIIIVLVFVVATVATWAQSYPLPDLSPKDISEWVIAGGQIASGSAEPTGVASEGALYIRTATPTAPVLYRYDSSDWQELSSSGGGSGVATHSELTNLDFDSAGHTGFNSAASFTEHTDTYIDPHGATMTVTQEISIGSGTFVGEFTALDADTISASGCYFAVPDMPEYESIASATDAGLATGTLFHNASGIVYIVK